MWTMTGDPITFPIGNTCSQKNRSQVNQSRKNRTRTNIRRKTKMALPKTIFDADGNVKDYEKSFPLLLAHAKEGDPIAQSLVGYCYLNGLGVRKNRLEAHRWLRDAASQGDVDAMSNLGLMFEIG